LKETSESLDSKSLAVSELELRIDGLNTSLAEASAGIEAKQAIVEELETAKRASENELQDAKDALGKLKSEAQNGSLILQSVRNEVALHLLPLSIPSFFLP
jgi:chromosome segregation ATPase